jgi:hypothetical protein
VAETARYVQLLVPMLWVGMVVAISFLEAPIKFRAPGVTLPLGLGIGRLVFKALNIVEIVLLVAISAAAITAAPPAAALILLIAVAVALVFQIGVVRPLLRRRSARILAGQDLPRSSLHWVYIALEVAKVGLLVALATSLTAAVIACMP